MSGFTPVNQVRLTNVAYVRLTKAGKRFEIACYRNKVLTWRSKIETDLGEVLQIDTVFTNVSKGLLASSKDLMEAFGTADQRTVCKEILDKGELQVSEQERGAQIDGIFRDVASIVTDKTINPENNRPYTISMIQNAMRQIHYSVNVSKSAKSQALDVIRKLRDVMPIARASMLLRIVCPILLVPEMQRFLQSEMAGVTIVSGTADNLETMMTPEAAVGDVATASTGDGVASSKPAAVGGKVMHIDVKVDPEYFRKVEEGVNTLTNGEGRLEVLQLRVASTTAAAATSSSAAHVLDGPDKTLPQTIKATAAAATAKGGKGKKKKHTGGDEDGEPEKETEEGTGDLLLATGRGGRRRTGKGDGDAEDEKLLATLNRLAPLEGGDEGDDGDENSTDEGDDTVYGMVTKKNSKLKKRKDKGGMAAAGTVDSTTLSPSPRDGSDEDEDNEDEGGRIEPSVSSSSSTAAAGDHHLSATTAAHRKGKKTKRMEKEKQSERDQRAVQLKERVELEHERLTKTTPAVVATDVLPVTVAVGVEGVAAEGTTTSAASATAATAAGSQKCNTCGGSFPDATAYRAHFRSEWHRHNLQRKLKNLAPVPTEEAFSALPIEELERVAAMQNAYT